jgi:hypothetical protein
MFSQVSIQKAGEPVTCHIKRIHANTTNTTAIKYEKGLSYQLKANSIGYFSRVSNLLPNEKVAIELVYPLSNSGEKIVISVEDGGSIEGKKIQVMHLDTQKKIAFDFNLGTDPGIYRLRITKGKDSKVIQLWVGRED